SWQREKKQNHQQPDPGQSSPGIALSQGFVAEGAPHEEFLQCIPGDENHPWKHEDRNDPGVKPPGLLVVELVSAETGKMLSD
ncbi:hypothetical protein, partial [Xenorhabdus bovienii]|uniref:hypothetical protein n=1 Tax=Xenorhabdus bovienii TaxID=40576 RepID=UPI00237D0CDF